MYKKVDIYELWRLQTQKRNQRGRNDHRERKEEYEKHSVSLHYGAGYGMMKCAEKAEQITQAQSSYVMPEMAGGGGARNGD